jgi:hypothetical protein
MIVISCSSPFWKCAIRLREPTIYPVILSTY